MKTTLIVFGILAVTALSGVDCAYASKTIQIASINDNTPELETAQPLTIEVSDHYFELNNDMTRARLVVDYNVECYSDPTPIVDSTYAEIPGLVYDAGTGAIVFKDGGTTTPCATVKQVDGIFGKHTDIEETGLCTVTSQWIEHDDGWDSGFYDTLDVYFQAP